MIIFISSVKQWLKVVHTNNLCHLIKGYLAKYSSDTVLNNFHCVFYCNLLIWPPKQIYAFLSNVEQAIFDSKSYFISLSLTFGKPMACFWDVAMFLLTNSRWGC